MIHPQNRRLFCVWPINRATYLQREHSTNIYLKMNMKQDISKGYFLLLSIIVLCSTSIHCQTSQTTVTMSPERVAEIRTKYSGGAIVRDTEHIRHDLQHVSVTSFRQYSLFDERTNNIMSPANIYIYIYSCNVDNVVKLPSDFVSIKDNPVVKRWNIHARGVNLLFNENA